MWCSEALLPTVTRVFTMAPGRESSMSVAAAPSGMFISMFAVPEQMTVAGSPAVLLADSNAFSPVPDKENPGMASWYCPASVPMAIAERPSGRIIVLSADRKSVV